MELENSQNQKFAVELYQAILSLENSEEAARFFRDLLTEPEISEFSRRFQAAKMLDAGIPYSEISRQLGLSSTTVARISKWLNNGLDGYRLVLSRQHHHNSNQSGRGLS